MRNALRGAGKLFMAMCTVLVVLAGLTYVVGKAIGIPVRVTYQTVAGAVLPEAQRPAPKLPAGALAGDSTVARQDTAATPQVQNVILFIGDGMGLSMLASVDALAERRLAMGQMPVTGLVRVASLSSLITDSAAGATAFATGQKTTNGAVAMAPKPEPRRAEQPGTEPPGSETRGTEPPGSEAPGQEPPESPPTGAMRALTPRRTILEAVQAKGFATGVVTTSYLTDATPASFTAHAASRDDYGTIARQMVASGTDVLIGGTQAVFTDSLRRAARQQGFTVGASLEALTQGAAPADGTARWLGLFRERAGRFDKMHGPPLVQTVEAVLENLQRRGERFFLVVEQEGTDAAGHTNRLQDARAYLRELDRAVEYALGVAARQGSTLVLVTADHDTGGLSITGGADDELRVTARWNSFGHTAEWTPLLAYGPGAARFTGVQENTALPVTMARLLGLGGFLEKNAKARR